MLDALFLALSHPRTIVGRDGAGDLLLMAVGVMLITAAFMAVAGRRIMRRATLLAVVLGAAFVPFLMIAIACLLAWNAPARTDGAGILVVATLVLAIGALPVTIATSVSYVLLMRRHDRRASPPPA